MKPAEKTIWVDRLSLPQAWQILRMARQEKITVKVVLYFADANPFAKAALQIFCPRRGPLLIKKISYDLSLHDVSDQESLFWHVWRDIFRLAWNSPLEDESVLDAVDSRNNRFQMMLYLKRQMAYDQRRNLALIRLVHWHASQEPRQNFPENNHVLFIANRIWQKNLFEYAKRFGVNVYFFDSCPAFLGSLKTLFSIFIRFGIYLWLGLLACVRSRPKPAVDSSRPKVAVYYAQGLDFNRRSDLFWFPNGAIDPNDIFVYFLIGAKTPSPDDLDFLRKNNIPFGRLLTRRTKWGDYLSGHPRDYHHLMVRKLFHEIKAAVKLLFKIKGGFSPYQLWMFNKIAVLLIRVAEFEVFFLSENIKINFGFMAEDDQTAIAVNMAMGRVGGIDTYAHWSNYPIEQIMPAYDVFFSWGPYFRPLLECLGHGIGSIVYSGYIFDHTFSLLDKEARECRQKFIQKGTDFLIGFFDNTFAEGACFSKKDFIVFYTYLLKELEKNPRWGLLIKPKRLKDFHQVINETDLREQFKRLEEEGRCLVLDEKRMPMMVALASDLVIGYGAFSTPAVESMLTKTKTVVYDPTFQRSHALYARSHGRVVFDDLKELFVNIEQFYLNRNGAAGFGEYLRFFPDIDPFNDGRAAYRVGQYIKYSLDSFRSGAAKAEVMERANKMYQKNFSDDKVFSFKTLASGDVHNEETSSGKKAFAING